MCNPLTPKVLKLTNRVDINSLLILQNRKKSRKIFLQEINITSNYWKLINKRYNVTKPITNTNGKNLIVSYPQGRKGTTYEINKEFLKEQFIRFFCIKAGTKPDKVSLTINPNIIDYFLEDFYEFIKGINHKNHNFTSITDLIEQYYSIATAVIREQYINNTLLLLELGKPPKEMLKDIERVNVMYAVINYLLHFGKDESLVKTYYLKSYPNNVNSAFETMKALKITDLIKIIK